MYVITALDCAELKIAEDLDSCRHRTLREIRSLKSEQELLDFLKDQIKIENQIANSLNDSLREIANPAVKSALKGISLDSVKHSELY